ncbi:hypothetical protein [Pseudomonas monteilii]|uniref:hypothetical protein n=1 Tax=Pseudomonas monteilii TaxID=76759 RepID=UPI001FD06AAA|nr:hypothetical protein [Pseudomonas monteilii]MCJ7853016.1 hypothetical protein [Pseudomonas monteilii]
MDAGFVDLDILLTRIRHPQSKVYFLDAVKAYKAGALRGALTSAWVALAYDLIAKYRELSALGDAAAATFLQEWDNATINGDISKLLLLERNILDHATGDTQVVNQLARKHLERLREDRNLCAHPAFSAEADLFEPSAELVRLHLVNTVTLVLAQEPLQGKAISELFDIDVQSPGFPISHERILDYVEQRYLARVRSQNVRNFATVLAKSLLKGVPVQWEMLQHKIISSLVAVRDRAPAAWPDVSHVIANLLNNAEPVSRPRGVAFLAAFPDFWEQLNQPTRTALQETVNNSAAEESLDYRILAGISLPQFRESITALIAALTHQQLVDAISTRPLAELWPKAIGIYSRSNSWRGSEERFRELIMPFAGQLGSQQLDELIDAITQNGQNWDAAETQSLLLGLLRNTPLPNRPTPAACDRFYQHARENRLLDKYGEVFTLLQGSGWNPPLANAEAK